MSIQAGLSWPYSADPPATSATSANAVAFTTVPFPVSPDSISPSIGSSPSSIALPSPKMSPKVGSKSRKMSRKQGPKTSSTSSSLPDPKELSIEDDWTRVKCPKEKKRIQNRVAQRTYRHRMKARLGELQARLDSHERQRDQQAMALGSDVTYSNARVPRSLNGSHVHGSDGLEGANGLSSMSSMMLAAHGLERTSSHSTGSSPHPGISMLQHGLREHCIDESEPAFYSHNAQYFHSPSNSYPSPQATSALISPTGRLDGLEQNKASRDLVLDCLHFQNHFMNKRNVLETEPGYFNQGQSQYNSVNTSPQVGEGMKRDHSNYIGNFALAPPVDNLDFNLDGTRDGIHFKSRQSQAPVSPMTFPSLPESLVSPMDAMIRANTAPLVTRESTLPSKGARMDERVESAMRYIHATGFDSFDDLATAYYSTTLRTTSPLATEQHVSRSKRLPKVLSHVFRAADEWPHWEKCGFHDEVVNAAGGIVSEEASMAAQSSLTSDCTLLLQARDANDGPKMAEAFRSIMSTIQKEYPSAWAFNNSAFEGRDGTERQPGSANVKLANILLQQLAGHMPREQMLRVIEACL